MGSARVTRTSLTPSFRQVPRAPAAEPAVVRGAQSSPASADLAARPAADLSAADLAAALTKATGGELGRAGGLVLDLQRTRGNRHVQRVVQAARGTAPAVQAKLTVGPPGDRYEREADRVAREVSGRGQGRQYAVGADARPVAGPVPGAGGAARGGQVIPEHVRAPIEQAMGADFSGVRVHTGEGPDRLNRQLQATAFTMGHDIFFRRGAYDTRSAAGREVLAHELTHVIQQHGSGEPVIRCYNRITSTNTNRVAQPLWVLHQAFGADFTTQGVPETYSIYGKTYDPANPDTVFTKGVAQWKRPNRPESVTATLDGIRGGGARVSKPPQYLYGYLGIMERAMFGRPALGPVYEGGHFISDEILGDDSYSEFNFAPQDDQFNAPLWRIIEEMAELGPRDAAGSRAANWTYTVKVHYPADYTRTAQQLAQSGVLPQSIANLNPGKTVTFPRRIPDLWKAKMKAPPGYTFGQTVIKPTTHAHRYYNTTANAIETQAAVVRQASGIVDLGMDSLQLQTTALGTDKLIGGKQVEKFAALQYYPDDVAQQPVRTVTGPGGVAAAALVPQPRPQKLASKVSFTAAITDSTSPDRRVITAAYPDIAGYVWKDALPWAWSRVENEPYQSPLAIVDRVVSWKGRSSTKTKPTVKKPQMDILRDLIRDSNLIL